MPFALEGAQDAETSDKQPQRGSSETPKKGFTLEGAQDIDSGAVDKTEKFANAKMGRLSDLARADYDKATKLLGSRNPKADYETGLPFSSKVAYLGQDTNKERQKFLDKTYPGAKLVKDPGGRDLIQFQNGKTMEPSGSGFWRNLGAEVVSHAPETGGMLTGAVAGAELGAPLGPIGAGAGGLMGAAIGGVGGKMAEEGLKKSAGIENKTEREYVSSLNKAGQEGAEAETGGKVADKVISKLVGGYPFGLPFLGKNAEINKDMTQRSLDRGMVPPTAKAVPAATLLSQKQTYLEKVLGSTRDAQNVAAAKQGMANVLKKSGVPDQHIEDTIHAILRGESDVKNLGSDAEKYYKTYVDNLQSTAAKMRSESSDLLAKKFSDIDKKITRSSADPSLDVKRDILNAKEDFSDTANRMYGTVDELVGNKPVLSTQPMKDAIKKAIINLPKDKQGNIIFPGEGGEAMNRYVKNLLEQPDHISFQQGQIIRSQLLHESYNGDLLKSLGDKHIGDIADAADSMFSKAAQGYIKSGGKGDEVKRAAKALQDADKWYGENIQKFKDRDVAMLARDVSKPGSVRPEDVVKFVADPRYASKMTKILSMLSPETRQAIARLDFERMLEACQNMTKFDGSIDAKKLMIEIAKREATAPILWGKKTADEIRVYAKRLAALNGDIPLDAMKGDSSQIVGKLRMAAKTQEEAQNMLKNDQTFLSALGKEGFLHDDAFNLMFQPGQEHRCELAMKMFRGTPVEAEIKKAFVQKIMSNIATPKNAWQKLAGHLGDSGSSLNVTPMAKELGKYSDKQLSTILGKDLAKDFKLYAEDLDFAMGQHAGDIAASLAAGAARLGITLFDPFQWKRYAGLAVGEYILSRPGVLKFIALGWKYPEGSPMRVAVENAIKGDLDNFLIAHRKEIQQNNKK